MAFLASDITSKVGLKLLLCPLGSNIVTRAACCSVGVVLPVYSTFRAIERNDENEHQKWLTYWAAYGSFTVVEVFSDKLLSSFPYYYHSKFAFLVWLQLPSTEGAKQIYGNHLRPFLSKHQATIDRVMGFAYAEMARFISMHQEEFKFTRILLRKIGGSEPNQSGATATATATATGESGGLLEIEDQTRVISYPDSDSNN